MSRGDDAIDDPKDSEEKWWDSCHDEKNNFGCHAPSINIRHLLEYLLGLITEFLVKISILFPEFVSHSQFFTGDDFKKVIEISFNNL